MKKILNSVAKVGMASAKNASSKVSWIGCYQKEEPVALKKMNKKN